MRHEVNACDFIRLPFDIACAVLDRNRDAVLDAATRAVFLSAESDQEPSGPHPLQPRVVSAPLERHDRRSATLDMHWVQNDPTLGDWGGLSAWLHCHLWLLPRRTSHQLLTEVLLTARCETSPRDPSAFTAEKAARFLRTVVAWVELEARRQPDPAGALPSPFLP